MPLQHVKYIVLVLSGKGGVGKSSVTTQLALSLNLQGHNVGILDVDLTGPSMPRLLGIEDSKVTQVSSGWTPVKVHDVQELPPARRSQTVGDKSSRPNCPTEPSDSLDGLSFDDNQLEQNDIESSPTKVGSLHAMSLAFLLASRSTAIVWRGPKKTAMIRQFLSTVDWPKGTDYLLVDTPPGTSDEHISLVETLLKEIEGRGEVQSSIDVMTPTRRPNLAGAVIVTTPQAVAVSDVRKELNFCAKTGVKVLGVVENMSGYVCPCCGEPTNLFSKGGGQIMAADFGVPFLGSVPVDPLWGVLVEEGKRPRYEKAVADVVPTKQEDLEGLEKSEEERGEDAAAAAAAAAADDDDDDDDDKGDDAPLSENIRKEREKGLLVDKYRDCLLSPIFAEVAHEVHDRAVNGTAVSLT